MLTDKHIYITKNTFILNEKHNYTNQKHIYVNRKNTIILIEKQNYVNRQTQQLCYLLI